jgi:hypothetical protein
MGQKNFPPENYSKWTLQKERARNCARYCLLDVALGLQVWCAQLGLLDLKENRSAFWVRLSYFLQSIRHEVADFI